METIVELGFCNVKSLRLVLATLHFKGSTFCSSFSSGKLKTIYVSADNPFCVMC